MKISFHGADQEVTGSCHLIECSGKTILIDCGMFQGSRELSEDNADPFDFDPATIDYLLLTHAHLDHCGRLPLLTKRGFNGEIITTSASRELARLILLDSAHLQEEEAGSGYRCITLFVCRKKKRPIRIARRQDQETTNRQAPLNRSIPNWTRSTAWISLAVLHAMAKHSSFAKISGSHSWMPVTFLAQQASTSSCMKTGSIVPCCFQATSAIVVESSCATPHHLPRRKS